MIIKVLKCEQCGDIIYSRHRHDMRRCSCKDIAIDGGRDYTRIAWTSGERPPVFDLDIGDVSIRQLEDDYNYRENKYGKLGGN